MWKQKAEQVTDILLGTVATLLIYMPWIAALVIGFYLTRFNVKDLHHSLLPGVLLWLGLPFLLAGLHYWMYKDGAGTRTEMGCGCGLLPLILFLILWPTFMQARQKALKLRHIATPAPVLPRHTQIPKTLPK